MISLEPPGEVSWRECCPVFVFLPSTSGELRTEPFWKCLVSILGSVYVRTSWLAVCLMVLTAFI